MLQAKLDWLDAHSLDGFNPRYSGGRWRRNRLDPGHSSLELLVDSVMSEMRADVEHHMSILQAEVAKQAAALAEFPVVQAETSNQ